MLKVTSPAIDQTLGRAVELHRTGQLAQADTLYLQVLQAVPDHPEALRWRGILASQCGYFDIAVQLMQRSLTVAPDSIATLNDFGSIYLNANKFPEAKETYRRALAIDPRFAECWSNLGLAEQRSGNMEAAIAAFRQAIAINPKFPEPFNGLGVALKDTGHLPEAIEALQKSLELRPDFPEALNNLGNAFKGSARFDEAVVLYRRAIALRYDFPEAHNNLANALKDCGRLEDAIQVYRDALKLRPNWAEIHNNLANALKDCGRMEEAVTVYRQALALRPGLAAAHSNLAYVLHYLVECDPAETFQEYLRWNQVHAAALTAQSSPHENDPSPERRLRIGYVSPDLRTHSVAYFMESLLAHHDPAAVEVFCYADISRPDEMTERLQQLVPHWRSTIGLPDEQVAEIVRKDQIDILVDLSGHTAANRLLMFARKPAPVQVTYLGYPGTTGLSAIDYRLTDALADPEAPGEATDAWYSEKLVRLPGTFLCYHEDRRSPPVQPPPCIDAGHITFGSFNAVPKISDMTVGIWADVLRQTPGSRLLLKTRGLSDETQRARLHTLFAAQGIAPERIDMIEKIPAYDEHLGAYNRVDIALETFPYNGTTTTCEALWMGVPVLTLAGKVHVSRVGLTLLTAVGLPELIAFSPEEYVKKATALAADVERLKELRTSLRDRMQSSRLMDAPRFAANVEAAYRTMWRTWCNQKKASANV